MECHCPSQQQVLEELEKAAPSAPFLALGQTVFWDEPVKAGLLRRSIECGFPRRFLAGVHDTDYFAKLPSGRGKGGYQAFPHNDTTTKAFWSAAAEFSALFGSETVVSRETLARCGVNIAKVARERPGELDSATEAWGWRGVASLGPEAKVTAETPIGPLLPVLAETLDWAVRTSVEMLPGSRSEELTRLRDAMHAMVCADMGGSGTQTLSEFYRSLLPELYNLASGEDTPIEVTATTELLRFNRETCARKRFDLVRHFMMRNTRQAACEAYDASVHGGEIYTLDRFGAGAIPFDLIVPGRGRGTIRLGKRGAAIMTPTPLFLSVPKTLDSLEQLAEAVEAKLGPNCTLVGKAVSLIGMLAREFVFVFHEGASPYVSISRYFHEQLRSRGLEVEANPILRIRYEPWDAIAVCQTKFRLPQPLRRPFGADEIEGPAFAARWRQVASEQSALLGRLASLRRPSELLHFLTQRGEDGWEAAEKQYAELHQLLDALNAEVESIRERKRGVLARQRELIVKRAETERAKGHHWRERLFEKAPSAEALAQRETFSRRIRETIAEITGTRREWRALQDEQHALVTSERVRAIHARRRALETDAEVARIEIVREAVIASQGLVRSGHRPSAWWFPLVCPGGGWFEETMRAASYYLEPLS